MKKLFITFLVLLQFACTEISKQEEKGLDDSSLEKTVKNVPDSIQNEQEEKSIIPNLLPEPGSIYILSENDSLFSDINDSTIVKNKRISYHYSIHNFRATKKYELNDSITYQLVHTKTRGDIGLDGTLETLNLVLFKRGEYFKECEIGLSYNVYGLDETKYYVATANEITILQFEEIESTETGEVVKTNSKEILKYAELIQ